LRVLSETKINKLFLNARLMVHHAFLLVPAQAYVGKFRMTFKDYPPRQRAASFNLDSVMKQLQEGGKSN